MLSDVPTFGFGDSLLRPRRTVPALRNITSLVRILHLRYKTACFPWKNEGFEATLATHWTTHQGPRQRTRRHSTCKHARACLQESQSNWPEMRKTLGKPGFCSTGFRKLTEGTGTELLGVFPEVSGEFERQSPWNRRYRSGTWIISVVARE
jgi:hypothetical protein